MRREESEAASPLFWPGRMSEMRVAPSGINAISSPAGGCTLATIVAPESVDRASLSVRAPADS
jgi:hypothetical protein